MHRIIGIEEFVTIWLVATTWGYLPSCQKLVADAAAPNAHTLAAYVNITAAFADAAAAYTVATGCSLQMTLLS